MLTQQEADFLIRLSKKLILPGPAPLTFPTNGRKLVIDAVSLGGRERFVFDVNRASVKITKATYQNRGRGIVLLRLDVDGPPHENPDDERTLVPCPHLHVYKEGWGTRWAYPCPPELAVGEDLVDVLIAFLRYCSVTNIPPIQRGLT